MLSNEQILSIATDILLLDDFKLATLESATGTDWLEPFSKDLSSETLADIVLMMHTEELYEDLSAADYLVLDSEDRDQRVYEYAENYYYDIVECDIPEHLRYYFNEDAWIQDYVDELDAGVALSGDGEEHEYSLLGQNFYVYLI